MKSIQIPFEEKTINGLLDEAKSPVALIILAHGAGAGMTHSFMETLSQKLIERHISVLRFNFPYMDDGRKSPGSPKANIKAWNSVVLWAENNSNLPLFVSGKSYGGRMASHLMADTLKDSVKGIVYFGFPLHAPGKDSKDRADHLTQLRIPQLFLQGTKDALAKIELMQEVNEGLSNSTLIEFNLADHSFKTKGRKIEDVIDQLAMETKDWIQSNLQ